jgi:hypothetical protein
VNERANARPTTTWGEWVKRERSAIRCELECIECDGSGRSGSNVCPECCGRRRVAARANPEDAGADRLQDGLTHLAETVAFIEENRPPLSPATEAFVAQLALLGPTLVEVLDRVELLEAELRRSLRKSSATEVA